LDALPAADLVRQIAQTDQVDHRRLDPQGGLLVGQAVCQDVEPWFESGVPKFLQDSCPSGLAVGEQVGQHSPPATLADVEGAVRSRIDVQVGVVAELPGDLAGMDVMRDLERPASRREYVGGCPGRRQEPGTAFT
jgi:hypothetical protein